jgi:peptidoglycan-associated lipoprotein
MPLTRSLLQSALLIAALAACAPQAPPPSEAGRFLVYYDEFSANMTPAAQQTVADAARRAREVGARAIRIEGRASATGSPTANQYLVQTRTQVVADELQKNGLDRATFKQVWIGQTGSDDPSVAERRVDIVLER